MRVAVTGAAGHVGSTVVRRLLELDGVETVAICRNSLSAGLGHFAAPGAEIRIGSLADPDAARRLIGDCDAVINCALAVVSRAPRASLRANRAIVDAMLRSDRNPVVIHLSSLSVYGDFIDPERRRSSTFERPRPQSDYGRSKLDVERHSVKSLRARRFDHYIVRLGHVFGAAMGHSRRIVELAGTRGFELPFGGDLPSNAIHAERVAAILVALLDRSLPSGIYNLAEEGLTWREVFDWHTEALGMPPVVSMPRARSERLRDQSASRSVVGDLRTWMGGLPVIGLVRLPSTFDLAVRALAMMPQVASDRLASTYKRLEVRHDLGAAGAGLPEPDPMFLGGAMPGPNLALPPETQIAHLPPETLSSELRAWHQRLSRARWLPDSILEGANPELAAAWTTRR
jgi:nucleoside-diphosphate-sugar epimerase